MLQQYFHEGCITKKVFSDKAVCKASELPFIKQAFFKHLNTHVSLVVMNMETLTTEQKYNWPTDTFLFCFVSNFCCLLIVPLGVIPYLLTLFLAK